MSEHSVREPTGWHRIGLRAGWIAVFAVPAWIMIVRFSLGVDSVGVFLTATILPLALLFLGLVALGIPKMRGFFASGRTVAWLWIAWAMGFILGLFMPDNTLLKHGSEQETTALVSTIFGPGMEGAASAISNPLAIVMIFSAILAAVFAMLDSRAGGPIRTEDEDHLQGTGFYPLLDDQ